MYCSAFSHCRGPVTFEQGAIDPILIPTHLLAGLAMHLFVGVVLAPAAVSDIRREQYTTVFPVVWTSLRHSVGVAQDLLT